MTSDRTETTAQPPLIGSVDDVPHYLIARYAVCGADSTQYTYEEWCQIYPLTTSASRLRALALPTPEGVARDVFLAEYVAAEQARLRGETA